MKRTIKYIAIFMALTLVASCNVIEETPSGSGLIGFSPKSVATKAMVNPEDLTGLVFDVYDILTASGTSSLHIDNYIAYNTTSYNWTYQDPDQPSAYSWLDGEHRFFGCTQGTGTPDLASKTLTFPEATLTTASEQTDILYSDLFKSTAEDWKASKTMADSVELSFHHLLSAVSVTLVNYTGAALPVQSVTVSFPNKADATVDYSGDDAVVTVSDVVKDGNFGGFTSAETVAAGDSIDVLKPSNNLSAENAKASQFLIWPQTGDDGLAEGAATVVIDLGNNNTKTAAIPAGTKWNPGEVNAYRILIYPDFIILQFEVQDWEKETINLDTNVGSINMTNVSWMNTKVKLTEDGEIENTVVISAYSVYMYKNPYIQNGNDWVEYDGYYPAQGFFTVNYPESGKFKIGLIPAYGETEVDEDMYEIYIYDPAATGYWRTQDEDGEAISRNTVYFQVRAASGQDGAQHKAQIDIWFLPDGGSEWISAYSEVRANYALTIPATN